MFNARQLLSVALSLSIFIPLATSAPSRTLPWLLERADDDFDQYDLSSIKSLAAIGDSYSAGIGAGNRLGGVGSIAELGAWACSRYDHAYPNLVNKMASLGDPTKRKFQFHSCSGAKADEIRKEQLPRIDNNQDAILLSAGGNDVDFVGILNQCVYQILTLSSSGYEMLKADARFADWVDYLPSIARSCETTLKDAQKSIEDSKFTDAIKSLITETKKKLAPGGTIYYTGYAKFWSEKMDKNDQCSKINWSVFGKASGNVLVGSGYQSEDAVKLIPERRKAMNDLVDAINNKLAKIIKDAGDQVVFVNYDKYFGEVGGRFCEAGVKEPDTTRIGLNFYELNIKDPMGTGPFKRDGGDVYEGTIEYKINQLGDMAATAGMQFKDDTLNKDIDTKDPDKNADPDNDSGKVGKRVFNPLPDGYGRVFHPQVPGHILIANYVVYQMARRRAATKKIDMGDEIVEAAAVCVKPTATGKPLCYIYGDSSGKYECQCGYDTPGKTGANYKTQSGTNICPYTTMPPDSLLATPKTTAVAAPTPTASVLIVHRAPPKTGPLWYGVYKVDAGFRKSVVGSCGYPNDIPQSAENQGCPFVKATDPCRADKARGEGKTPDRQLPVKDLDTGVNGCKYNEGTDHKGVLNCGSKTISCKDPDDNTRQAITPDNGRCQDGSTKIENVQTLVKVCELFP